MKGIITLIAITFFNQNVFSQFKTEKTFEYSSYVGDSFAIYTSLPKDFNEKKIYKTVYYLDANLKSGKQLRELISTSKYDTIISNCIFIGIGHIGNYHVLRRRDFIQPSIDGRDTVSKHKNYGNAEKFYTFLKKELMPSINKKFSTNTDSCFIIGHSLGGLFGFYCLFKNESLFTKYFALSPALWINNYSIYKFNQLDTKLDKKQVLYFTAGSKETVNKILKGTNEAEIFFKQKSYKQLLFEYDIWKGKTHNSEVILSLSKILEQKL